METREERGKRMRERERDQVEEQSERAWREGGGTNLREEMGALRVLSTPFSYLRTEPPSWVAQKHKQIVVLRTSLPFSPSVRGVQSAPAEAQALSAALSMAFAFRHWNMTKIHPVKKKGK